MQHRTTSTKTMFTPVMLRLDCGVTLAYDFVPSVESCAIGMWIKAGTRDEPRGQAGVAHLVEHTSFRRTTSRSNRRIARNFENVGAYANAYTTKEETCYYVRTLTDHIGTVFPALADVVINPVFSSKDVDKERHIIVEEIRSYEDEAEELAYDLAEQQLFGKHPLGNPIVGTVESVNRVSAEQVRDFHRRHYNSSSIVVAASGNVIPEKLIELANKSFEGMPRKRSSTRRKPPIQLPSSDQKHYRATQQAHVVWHTRTGGHHSKDRAALELLNVILGDGMTSRLHIHLRETRGLAYNITSQMQLFADVGMFSVYAGTDARSEAKVSQLIGRELADLAKNGIKPSELKRAKEQLRAARIMSLESLSARMSLLGKGILDEGQPENPYKSISEILSVTKEQVDAVAKSVCNPSRWHRLLLLPTS